MEPNHNFHKNLQNCSAIEWKNVSMNKKNKKIIIYWFHGKNIMWLSEDNLFTDYKIEHNQIYIDFIFLKLIF